MNEKPVSIEVQNLTKVYGKVKAIIDISFKIHQGEVVGFLGPNGAGKSTTMCILAGLFPATSGIAKIYGIPVALEPQKIRRHLCFMPENNPLPQEIRVIEYLRHRARLKEIPAKERKKRIESAMEICNLSRTAERKIIGKLSKGFKQRVGIADCLLSSPDVIIMDEPTIGLDPHQVLGMRQLIDSLRGQITLVLSSHILPEIEASCDRVIIINQGYIVAQGTSQALRDEFIPSLTYHLEIQADCDLLKSCLQELDPNIKFTHIQTASTDSRFLSLSFETQNQPSFGGKVIQAIQAHPDWQLREISRKEPTLEEIFIAATHPSWKKILLEDNSQLIAP